VSNDIPVPFVVIYKDVDGRERKFFTWAHTGEDAIQVWEEEKKEPDDVFIKVRQSLVNN